MGFASIAGASALLADAELLVLTGDGSDFGETVLVKLVLEQQTAAHVVHILGKCAECPGATGHH